MRSLNFIVAIVAGSLLMSSCTLQKMINLAKQQQLEVAPSPLEVHGDRVAFEMSAVLPAKMLPKGKVYTINTFYQYGDQEVSVGSVEFNADQFPQSSSATSKLSQDFTFDYMEGMSPGNLVVQGVASNPKNGKSKSSEKMPVSGGEGLILTSKLVKDVFPVAYADHGYNDQEELIPTRVDFFFEQGRSYLRNSEKTSERGDKFAAFIAEKNVTRTVTITGAHSPEGSDRANADLAEDRASVIEKFYRQLMRKYDYKGVADSINFVLKPVVKDWNSLKEALKTFDGLTNDQKSQVTRIVNGTGSFEEKEESLQNLDFYKILLNDVYPPLRVAKTEILTVKEKKSNAEIAVLSKQIVDGQVSADTLSFIELMFSASLTPSLKEKEAIFKAATKKGGMWQAHNNLGAVYLAMAKQASGAEQNRYIEDALTQIEIAANKMKAPEVWANMASAQAMQGDYAQAYSSLLEGEKAGGSGEVKSIINGAKGAIEIKNGQYDNAVASLSSADQDDIDVSFDRALAYLLKKEFDSADNGFDDVIDAQSDYAIAHYGKAIVAARKNNESGVLSNLKNAISVDPSLKEMALNDLEFSRFAGALSSALK
ncbi:MAG: hypothetical protein RIC80_22785 [Cyclobacteriaceae bacterium]